MVLRPCMCDMHTRQYHKMKLNPFSLFLFCSHTTSHHASYFRPRLEAHNQGDTKLGEFCMLRSNTFAENNEQEGNGAVDGGHVFG